MTPSVAIVIREIDGQKWAPARAVQALIDDYRDACQERDMLLGAHEELQQLMARYGYGASVYPQCAKDGVFRWIAYHRGWKRDCETFVDAVNELSKRLADLADPFAE